MYCSNCDFTLFCNSVGLKKYCNRFKFWNRRNISLKLIQSEWIKSPQKYGQLWWVFYLLIIHTFEMGNMPQYECFVCVCVSSGRVVYGKFAVINHNFCTKQPKIIRSTGHFDCRFRFPLQYVHVYAWIKLSLPLFLSLLFSIIPYWRIESNNWMHYQAPVFILASFAIQAFMEWFTSDLTAFASKNNQRVK